MPPTPLTPTHLINEIGFDHWFEGDVSWGRAAVRPGMCVPGTPFVRIGMLAILTDLAAGQPVMGPVTPTTDLSVRVERPRPMQTISVAASVLKAGATLLVVESMLTADDEREPFATSLATFMNRSIEVVEGPEPSMARLDQPLQDRIGAQLLRPGVIEMALSEDLLNGYHATVQGGVLATLGELAAESLWPGSDAHLVTDLDIRFLNRVKVGPVQALARLVVDGRRGKVVDVRVVDAGNDGRAVAHVSTLCVPLPDIA